MTDQQHAEGGEVKTTTIHPPPEITYGIYKKFEQERKRYLAANRVVEANNDYDIGADYAASRSLIKEHGVYHVIDPSPEFQRWLDEDDFDKVPGEFMSAIVFAIAYKIRGCMNDFLRMQPRFPVEVSKNGSSPTS